MWWYHYYVFGYLYFKFLGSKHLVLLLSFIFRFLRFFLIPIPLFQIFFLPPFQTVIVRTWQFHGQIESKHLIKRLRLPRISCKGGHRWAPLQFVMWHSWSWDSNSSNSWPKLLTGLGSGWVTDGKVFQIMLQYSLPPYYAFRFWYYLQELP